MTTVTLRLHDGADDESLIDLDRLTPRARALAEALAHGQLSIRRAILLESSRTLRELDGDPVWHGDLDRPHRTMWDAWAAYPVGSTVDPHDYLESEAAKLPIGYVPVGLSVGHRVPSADAALTEADLIGKSQVLALLRDLGRPLSPATLDNYRSRPPADWPQPARYVGRTPQWDRRQIEAYAASAV